MTKRSSIYIAIGGLLIAFVGTLWLVNVFLPYDTTGEGPKEENYPW